MATSNHIRLDGLPATFEEGSVISETENALLELRPNRNGDGADLALTADFKASRSESIRTTLSAEDVDRLLEGLEQLQSTLD